MILKFESGLDLIEDQGWILELIGRDDDAEYPKEAEYILCKPKEQVSDIIKCFRCKINNIEECKEGYYCKSYGKMICRECELKKYKGFCAWKDNHEHFNIINIKWTKLKTIEHTAKTN